MKIKPRQTKTVSDKYSSQDARESAAACINSFPKYKCHDRLMFKEIPYIGILYIPGRIGYRDQLIYGAEEPTVMKNGEDLYMAKILHVDRVTNLVTYAYLDDHLHYITICKRPIARYRVCGNVLVDPREDIL